MHQVHAPPIGHAATHGDASTNEMEVNTTLGAHCRPAKCSRAISPLLHVNTSFADLPLSLFYSIYSCSTSAGLFFCVEKHPDREPYGQHGVRLPLLH